MPFHTAGRPAAGGAYDHVEAAAAEERRKHIVPFILYTKNVTVT